MGIGIHTLSFPRTYLYSNTSSYRIYGASEPIITLMGGTDLVEERTQ